MITDEEFIERVKRKYGVVIGERSAEHVIEEVKRHLADTKIAVPGRELIDGQKKTVEVPMIDFI